MVTAAANTARPMTWPLTRRVSSGNDADTSATRMGTCAADGDAKDDIIDARGTYTLRIIGPAVPWFIRPRRRSPSGRTRTGR
jgi:hypothetical protein